MSIFTPDDYKHEAIKGGKLGKTYMKKVKLPSMVKTTYKYCRNCLTKNISSDVSCKQCGIKSFQKGKPK